MNKSNLMPKMVLGALVFSMATSQVSANDGKSALERSGVEMPSFWSRVFGPSAAELAKQAEEATKKATEEAAKKAAEEAAKAGIFSRAWNSTCNVYSTVRGYAKMPESRNGKIALAVGSAAVVGGVGYLVWRSKKNNTSKTNRLFVAIQEAVAKPEAEWNKETATTEITGKTVKTDRGNSVAQKILWQKYCCGVVDALFTKKTICAAQHKEAKAAVLGLFGGSYADRQKNFDAIQKLAYLQ